MRTPSPGLRGVVARTPGLATKRPSRGRLLQLERLEDRCLLDGLSVPLGGLPDAVYGSGWTGPSDPDVPAMASLSTAYKPLEGTEAWVDGSTVRYRVWDPNLGQWVNGQTAYAATLSIIQLSNHDGVVAWTVGYPNASGNHTPRVVGLAIYDSVAAAWKQASSGEAGVLSIMELSNHDGVVSWTIGYPEAGTGNYVARELGAAVYDVTLGAWQQFQTATSATSAGVRSIAAMANQDGVVAWTLGHPTGSPGQYEPRAVAMATYDYTLQQWQRFQTAAATTTNVSALETADGVVIWKVGYPVSGGAGYAARDLGYAVYDTARASWRAFQTSAGGTRLIGDITAHHAVVAWTIAYPDGGSGGYVTRDVGCAAYDVQLGYWQGTQTQHAATQSVVTMTNHSGLVAWTVADTSTAGAARDVGYATYDAALQQWQRFQTANPWNQRIEGLVNQDGVAAWTVGYRESGGTLVPRVVAAVTYDPGRAQWKPFQTAETGVQSIAELQTAGGVVAWRIYRTATSSTSARDVGLATYDYALGQWQQWLTAHDISVTVAALVCADGVAAWSTEKALAAAVYDHDMRQWQQYTLALTGEAVVGSLLTRSRLVAWTIAYPPALGEAPIPRDVGYATYDTPWQSWQAGGDTYIFGEVVNYFAIEDAAVRYAIDGTAYRRAYDAVNHVWQTGPSVPWSSFVAVPTAGVDPAAFRFLDMSVGAVETAWDFGDGSGARTRLATHAYHEPGVYTVTQSVSAPGGTHFSETQLAVLPSDTPTDLGTITLLVLPNQNPTNGTLWYTFQVGADGAFTADLSGGGIGPQTQLALCVQDANGLWELQAAGTTSLGFTPVTAGTDYYLMAAGLTGAVDVALANPLSISADQSAAKLLGTSGDDTLVISHDSPFTVVLNGLTYTLPESVTRLLVDGRGGTDQATVLGSPGDDTAVLGPGSGKLENAQWSVELLGIERIVMDGRGGTDVAEMLDTPGNDTFVAKPGDCRLTGPQMANQVLAFEIVHAYGRAGGSDQAHLYDTPGDDIFTANPTWGRLVGPGYWVRAKLFDSVQAYSVAGGTDAALLSGSAADDVLVASPDSARLSGDGYYLRAKWFDAVVATAGAGGSDQARLYDSPGSDTLDASPAQAVLAGPGFRNQAIGFGSVTAYATAGGYDVAQLADSPGDDTFAATPTDATLSGFGFSLRAVRFDQVHAYAAQGGYDVAELLDSAGDDTFVATPTYAKLVGTRFFNRVKLFDEVHAYAKHGGNDVARLYDSAGDDTLVARPDWARMSGPGYLNRAKFFPTVRTYSTAGGTDAAWLYDSPDDDLLEAAAHWACLQSNNAMWRFRNEAIRFESVTAVSSTGNDTKSIGPGTGFLALRGTW